MTPYVRIVMVQIPHRELQPGRIWLGKRQILGTSGTFWARAVT